MLAEIILIAQNFIAGLVHKEQALDFSPRRGHELSVSFSFAKFNLDFSVRKEIMTPQTPFFDRWLVNSEWCRGQNAASGGTGPAKTGGCRIARRKRQ